MYKIIKRGNIKYFLSKEYSYAFNAKTGFFARWGITENDDPPYSKFGPEIADIEITTSCFGVDNKICAHCYKSNTPSGTYMKFEVFKEILDKILPCNTLTQVALGLDAHAKTNPDLEKILAYCREKEIVPNATVAQLDYETAKMLAKYLGACAVSRYANKDACYDTVKMLTDLGMTQINIHCMIANENIKNAWETLHDIRTDERLAKLNAIVFLSLKQKGRGTVYTPLSQEDFSKLVNHALEQKISFGMDSCSAHKFLEAIKDNPNQERLKQVTEPCESCLFSIYFNTDGKFFPCSFLEEVPDWMDGLDIRNIKNFSEIWNNIRTEQFRAKLLGNSRKCPVYTI